jgi:hypothetical protein
VRRPSTLPLAADSVGVGARKQNGVTVDNRASVENNTFAWKKKATPQKTDFFAFWSFLGKKSRLDPRNF